MNDFINEIKQTTKTVVGFAAIYILTALVGEIINMVVLKYIGIALIVLYYVTVWDKKLIPAVVLTATKVAIPILLIIVMYFYVPVTLVSILESAPYIGNVVTTIKVEIKKVK